jgi:hypothetical protein
MAWHGKARQGRRRVRLHHGNTLDILPMPTATPPVRMKVSDE